jgi:outer membrane protein assembly factor BamD (BamD/ComL family)
LPVYKSTAILVFACALFLSVSRPLPAQEVAQTNPTSENDQSGLSEGKWYRQVESNLVDEKFDELDRMAAEYRGEESRFPGGEWKLREFYGALDAPQLTDKDSADHIAHLERWMQVRPESITARVALATNLHRWAWVARGNGMAETVTAEGWRLFNERI